MELQELRELKARVTEKYQSTKDKELKKPIKILEEIIKNKERF